MSHIRMTAIVEADLDDVEECIAKDYRYYVKLRSREEPFEATKNTYERVLTLIAEANANRDELKRCPFCGGEAHTYRNNFWWVACERANHGCVTMGAFLSEEEAVAAWNGRAE